MDRFLGVIRRWTSINEFVYWTGDSWSTNIGNALIFFDGAAITQTMAALLKAGY